MTRQQVERRKRALERRKIDVCRWFNGESEDAKRKFALAQYEVKRLEAKLGAQS